MKIEQIKVARDVSFFKKGLMDKWNLEDYHDIHKPCLFFGINTLEDVTSIQKHRGFKLLYFTSSESLVNLNLFMGIPNLVVKWNPYVITPPWLKVKKAYFEYKDFSMFKPSVFGDKIYCYDYHGNRNIVHSMNLQKKIPWEILFLQQGHKIEDILENYYNKCFLNLNLTSYGGNGLTTTMELSYMGRYSIMNTRYGFPWTLPFRNEEDILQLIDRESKKIGTIQKSLMENFPIIGEEWKDEEFWMK